MTATYIAYYRVSTHRQGQSGLGLEAQKAAATTFLTTNGAPLLAEHTEVESGKRANRPELAKAVAACRASGATLLIVKLDRLAHNVAFIANLLESGLKFTAVDMPNADRFMLRIYAAMAKEEARRIGERTRAALKAAKTRGVRLGANGAVLAAQNKADADQRASEMHGLLHLLLRVEHLTFRQVAERLNSLSVPTARGGS